MTNKAGVNTAPREGVMFMEDEITEVINGNVFRNFGSSIYRPFTGSKVTSAKSLPAGSSSSTAFQHLVVLFV